MAQYRIESQQGMDMGIFEAESAREALDAMARDAGYASHEASCEVTGSDPDDWTTSAFAFRRGGVSLLVTELEA
jgi:hypothetical protein